MSLKLGNDDVAKVMLGGQEVSAVYRGTDEVWSAGGGGSDFVIEAFSTYLHRGTSAEIDIENGIDLAGEGGMVWIKARGRATSHILHDTERGPGKWIASDTVGRQKDNAQYLKSFTSKGFSLGTGAEVNMSGSQFVSWSWRRLPGMFDAVVHTCDGDQGSLYPHNLGVVPDIVMRRNITSNGDWYVWARAMPNNNGGADGNIALNKDAQYWVSDTQWATNTPPTDTHLSNGIFRGNAMSGNEIVSYLFASSPGLCDIGTYTGTGKNDNEINLGWKPQWVMIKRTNASADWLILDSARGDNQLYPNLTSVEVSNPILSFEPKGFRLKNDNPASNEAGGEYLYMAIVADPEFRMPPEWEQMNQEVAEKIAKREAAKEAITEKVKDSKDIKDDG
jgi:hypothetical protein